MHAEDELYSQLRDLQKHGDPATAFADTVKTCTGHDEIVLLTVSYEKGRIFHTALVIQERIPLTILPWNVQVSLQLSKEVPNGS